MFDKLQQLSGDATSALETVTANGNGTGVRVGARRNLIAELRVAGPVTAGGTLAVVLAESATQGGSYATVATFPSLTATAIPTEGGGDPVLRVGFVTTQPWLRWQKTVGGSTPSLGGVSCQVLPPAGGVSAR